MIVFEFTARYQIAILKLSAFVLCISVSKHSALCCHSTATTEGLVFLKTAQLPLKAMVSVGDPFIGVADNGQ